MIDTLIGIMAFVLLVALLCVVAVLIYHLIMETWPAIKSSRFPVYTLASLLRVVTAVGLWFGTARYFHDQCQQDYREKLESMRAAYDLSTKDMERDMAIYKDAMLQNDTFRARMAQSIQDDLNSIRLRFRRIELWYDAAHEPPKNVGSAGEEAFPVVAPVTPVPPVTPAMGTLLLKALEARRRRPTNGE